MNNYRVFINTARFWIVFLSMMFFSTQIGAQENCSGRQILQAENCFGDDVNSDEKTLFDLINKYRLANGRGEVRLSAPLSMVANRRMLDLKQNLKVLTHSWSNCNYDIKDEKTWNCVTDSPKRLNSGYNGQGYETLYRTAMGRALPVPALDAWKKSTLHNSIILNLNTFKAVSYTHLTLPTKRIV